MCARVLFRDMSEVIREVTESCVVFAVLLISGLGGERKMIYLRVTMRISCFVCLVSCFEYFVE